MKVSASAVLNSKVALIATNEDAHNVDQVCIWTESVIRNRGPATNAVMSKNYGIALPAQTKRNVTAARMNISSLGQTVNADAMADREQLLTR